MKNQKIRSAYAAVLINAVSVGMAFTYSSTAIESMKNSKLNPDDKAVSWIISCLPLGAIVGGAIGGYLSNKIGRKGVLMYLSLLLVGGWLSIAYAPSLIFVYIGRFITGVCCGLICVVTPMYVVEISTPEERGHLGSEFQLFICLGIFLSPTLSQFLAWDWHAISGAVLAIVALLSMFPIPESPRWLVLHNEQADAVHAVNFLYGNANDPSVNELLSESLVVSTINSFTVREIFHPTFYKPAMLSITLMFFQQFCGLNAIFYYIPSIIKESKTSIDPAMASFMFWPTYFAVSFIDKIGRKKCLYISGLITFISLNAMSVSMLLTAGESSLNNTYKSIRKICIYVYLAGFSVGLGPVPWLMMSEMSPIRVRGLVCGLGTAFSWTFGFIITKSFFQIETYVSDFGTFWIYSVFCLLACFFTLIFIPETKWKTLEEIENYFAGGEPQIHPLPDHSTERFTDQDSE